MVVAQCHWRVMLSMALLGPASDGFAEVMLVVE
jgi:hypothetical protein